ncbi:MAG TPA: alpha-glucosidase [Clostridiales bacterium]|nr:alpha-glucosidase [Clostridiales bacterium]HPV01343.1 alpha-glucosidase [Clostridiales bacterium]
MAKWWQERVVYQIYPRSFQDTNGDGIGDIPGIIAHLDDLKDLGVGILWLSPVYPSPNADYGYDISDYCAINPEFGTMEDMERLIAEAGKRDIKIIMDLVINHTSDEHPWFIRSRDKQSPYRDYYIWRPGKNGKPPNNWMSFFGGSTWEYDEKSGEYYLHLFSKKQPDLNWRNPKVMEEIQNVMRFWLDKGIAGFRCDVINLLYKTSLENGRIRLAMALPGSEHYVSQEGTHEILRTLRREVLDHYDCFTVGETVFVTTEDAKLLCGSDRRELDMVFFFEHMETDAFAKWIRRKFNPARFARVISRWQNALEWNANYLENHDQPRSVSRFGDDSRYHAESAKMLGTLLLTLRGTPFIYQGQEIGMTNFDYTGIDQVRDVASLNIYNLAKRLHIPEPLRWKIIKPTSRDNARTPMQWDSSPNSGFTTGRPWIDVNGNYRTINVASQMKDPNSIRNWYKKLITLRNTDKTLIYGDFKALEITRRVFVYRRELEGRSVTVLLNFSDKPQNAHYSGHLIVSSYGRQSYKGVLEPYEAVLLENGANGE